MGERDSYDSDRRPPELLCVLDATALWPVPEVVADCVDDAVRESERDTSGPVKDNVVESLPRVALAAADDE